MLDIFDLEPRTPVCQSQSYILSYPHIVSYFSAKTDFDAADFVRGAHMVYGWMPTILELHPGSGDSGLAAGASLLTRAKKTGALSDQEITDLVSLVNNSLVGASKLLQFVVPDRFAIWDSNVFKFVVPGASYNNGVKKVENYRSYLHSLSQLQTDPRFNAFHVSVNEKIGYAVSPLRAIELIIYIHSKRQRG